MKKPQNYSKLRKKIIDNIEETGNYKVLHSDIIESTTTSSSYEHKFCSLVCEKETKNYILIWTL